MKNFFSVLAVVLVSSFALMAQDLQEGLVIHYPFEGNLTDTISGTTAENFGNLTFTEGRVGGQAVRFFTGTADPYFVTPSGALQVGPTADGGTAGTFSMFVNHRAGSPIENDRHNYIAQKNGCGPEDNNRGRVVLYRQGPTASPGPDSITSFVTGRRLLSDFKIDEDNAETWIHMTLTLDPDNNEWAFYADGTEISRDTFPGPQPENSCGEFVIGHHLTFTNDAQTFDGLMDDLRFYNRVLTDEEIVLLSQQFPVSVREEVVTGSLRVSPNPAATDQPISISLDRAVFRPGSTLQLRVADAAGRIVTERAFVATDDEVLLRHQLQAGVYTITMTDGAKLATTRLVVR